MSKVSTLKKVSEVTNGAKEVIDASLPYVMSVKLKGTSDMLFHRWNCEEIEAKAKAPKNSTAKKTDNIESFVYRDDDGYICVPGTYIRGSIINAAKYRQDPRSPRKSAMDLFKAAIIPLTTLCSLGTKEWDYEHKCRMVVQRAGINRTFPAFKSGWELECDLQVNLPEYVSPELLISVINDAGRLIGIADLRPTYGRFAVAGFNVK